ncbi:MAG: LysM peptidoglycan-binding domain-containing protein [Oscillospiraceae bacterium]|nr:LysM peptidoglycan-binding domain-containing protein [Oscillospiraceae bacterium]
MDDLSSADLAACATAYIKGIGLTDAEIAALKANLSVSAATAPAQYAEPDTGSPVYVVVEGDCLWNIAYSYYGTGTRFGEIAEANGIEPPYIIYIGQMLLIPTLGASANPLVPSLDRYFQ